MNRAMTTEGGGDFSLDLLGLCDRHVSPDLQKLLAAIRKGDFKAVLNDDRFKQFTDGATLIEHKRKAIEDRLQTAIDKKAIAECLPLLLLGITCLLGYVQHNVTGPETDGGKGSRAPRELEIDGEDFMTQTRFPEWLLFARIILVDPLHLESAASELESENSGVGRGGIEGMTVEITVKDGSTEFYQCVKTQLPCWLWWAGRVVFIHQRFLRHSAATLRQEAVILAESLLQTMDCHSSWNASRKAQLYLEITQWEYLYRRVREAKRFTDKAGEFLGIQADLSGAMGKRTVHQLEAKAQLVVVVGNKDTNKEAADRSVERRGNTGAEETKEDDVLLKPKWTEDVVSPQLSLLEQCYMLAKSDGIELGTANDELKSWEIEPYTQLILSQKASTFPIQTLARLSRVRHEKERSRTRERALASMESLVENVRHAAVDHFHRLSCVFALRFPTIVQLRKEMAQLYVSFGIVAEALSTYEELECWDELVLCYRLLEKKAVADQIVSRRLASDPDNPRFLCTLADLRNDPELYTKAWKSSKDTYPRAQRSLARYYLERKDYSASARAFELALSLNALHSDAWFSLGYCCLHISNNTKAMRAFTWCVQIDPENGEAWNNLGALWMRQKKPTRALWALKEAVKYKRHSWETWENYAKASQECGEHFQTAHGMMMVLDATDGKRLQVDLLETLVETYLKQDEIDRTSLGQRLVELLRRGSIGTGWSPQLWILFAKVYLRLKESALAKECLMKCFRQIQGATWKSDTAQFDVLVTVIAELVQYAKNHGGVNVEISSLALQLRGIIKQAERNYSDTERFQQLLQLKKEIDEISQTLA